MNETRLKRAISLPLLVAYGVGTMVGGGFYALLGRMAGHAGMGLPLAILVAAAVAFLTALSFSELASRLPHSSGESKYVQEAFGRKWLSTLIGCGVIATGVVSAATLSRAFVGFVQDLWQIPTWLGITLLVALLTGIAIRGILETVWVAAMVTAVELAGLFWVITTNATALTTIADRLPEMLPAFNWTDGSGILIASFLAFYAFIGFEDMVNEAEEVQDPRRNLPRGILYSMIVTTALYLLVGLVAVLAVAPDQLAASQTPLALLVTQQGTVAKVLMVLISMLAGVNGALVQIVMASRVAYGMSDQGLAPQFLAKIHPTRRTPIAATLTASAIVLTLALWLPLETLAMITGAIMLLNFALVNASLVRIKLGSAEAPTGTIQYPIAIPILGCGCCIAFLVARLLMTF